VGRTADRTTTRRAALRAAGGLLLAPAVLSACGRPAQGGPIVLQLQTPDDGQLLAQMIPAFEAAEPGIRVNVSISGEPGAPSLAAALLSNTGPDVFWDNDPSRYLGTPLVADLLPLATASGFDLAAFGSAVLAAYRLNGGLYMLPRSVSPSIYAARVDLWAAAGIALPAPPYTADELAARWVRLSTDDGRVIGGQLAWSPTATYYLNGWGGHLVDPTNRSLCALGAPAALACGQWMWDRFWSQPCAQGLQGQYAQASFTAGTLAMQVVPCAGLPAFAASATGVPWRLVAFPTWPAGNATSADADFYALSAASAHPEAAWRLLTFISSDAWQQAAISSLLLCPSRIGLWDQYVQAIPRILPALRGQPLDLYAQPVQQDWALPTEQFRVQPPTVAPLNTYWQHIFGPQGSLSVAAGFPAAAAAVDALERAAGT